MKHIPGSTAFDGNKHSTEAIGDAVDALSGAGGLYPVGETYFVDGVNGNDANDGTTLAKAKLTIDAGIALCSDNENDYIFIAAAAYDENAAAAGVTVDVEGITIIGVGKGQATVVNSNAGATAVFTVTSDEFDMTGLQIIEAINTVEGMLITGDASYIHGNEFIGAMENGIQLSACADSKIEDNYFNGITNDGVEISGVSVRNKIEKNKFFAVGDNAINLNGNGVDGNEVSGNIIDGAANTTDVGINIVLGDNNNVSNNFTGGCTAIMNDTGTANSWVGNQEPSLFGAGNTIEEDIRLSAGGGGGSTGHSFPLGNSYYVATTGNDANDGTTWAKAMLTIDAAIALCTNNNNDYIYVAPGAYDEDGAAAGVTMDIAGVHLIACGNFNESVYIENTNVGATAVVTVTAIDCEIAGFYVYEGTATVDGIVVTGGGAWVHHNYFDGTMENGVRLSAADVNLVENNRFYDISDDAIELAGGSTANVVRDNYIHAPLDIGIHISGGTGLDNYVHDNIIDGENGVTDVGIQVAGQYNIISNNQIGGCTATISETGALNSFTNNHEPSLTGAGGATIEQDINVAGNSPKAFPQGNVYFVDPTQPDNTKDGTSWLKAKLTIDAAIALCTANNGDYIFVGAGDYDEQAAGVNGVTVDIAGVTLIGAGKGQVTVDNSDVTPANYVFNVTADEVEITGFTIDELTNTCEGLYISGDSAYIHNNSLEGAMENAIHLDGANGCAIQDNYIASATNDGIELSGASTGNNIVGNRVIGCGDNGINLNGDDVDNNRVHHNHINGSAGTTDVGINIALGDSNMINDNRVGECGTSYYADTGSNNIWVRNSPESETAGTLNDANVTDTITPIDTPRKAYITINFSAVAVNLDDFLIEILVGPGAAELIVAWYNITRGVADRSIDRGDGIASVVEEEQIDIGPLSVPAGCGIRLDYTKNSVNDRNFLYTINFEEY